MAEYARKPASPPHTIHALTRAASSRASSPSVARPPARGHLETLQAALNQSPRVRALAQLQLAVNQSPRVAERTQFSMLVRKRTGATLDENAPHLFKGVPSNGVVQGLFDMSWIPWQLQLALASALGFWFVVGLIASCMRSGMSQEDTLKVLEAKAETIKTAGKPTETSDTPADVKETRESPITALQDVVNTVIDQDKGESVGESSESALPRVATDETASATTIEESARQESELTVEEATTVVKQIESSTETEVVAPIPITTKKEKPVRRQVPKKLSSKERKRQKEEQEAASTSSSDAEPQPETSSRFIVGDKDREKARKTTGFSVDDIAGVADWVSDQAMWKEFAATKESVEVCLNVSTSFSAKEVHEFKSKHQERDYVTAATAMLEMGRLSAEATAEKKVKSPPPTKNSLGIVEAYWTRQSGASGVQTGTLSVATSRSGGAMLLLKGLHVNVDRTLTSAHISLPSDGNGSFSEGHLKIEGGPLLNQYFFVVDEYGDARPVGNSPAVPTQNPGKWSALDGGIWTGVKIIVKNLAVGKLT